MNNKKIYRIGICKDNTVANKYIYKHFKNHLVGYFDNDTSIIKALENKKIDYGIVIGGFNDLDLTKNIKLIKKLSESQINIISSINISADQPIKIYSNHESIRKIILYELRICENYECIITNDYNIADIIIYVDSNPNKFINHITNNRTLEYVNVKNIKIANKYIREFVFDLQHAIKMYPNIVIANKTQHFIKSFKVQNILLSSMNMG